MSILARTGTESGIFQFEDLQLPRWTAFREVRIENVSAPDVVVSARLGSDGIFHLVLNRPAQVADGPTPPEPDATFGGGRPEK